MSVLGTTTNSTFLSVPVNIPTGAQYPMTLACWLREPGQTTAGQFFGIGNSGALDGFLIHHSATALRVDDRRAGANSADSTTEFVSATTWFHCAGQFITASSRANWVNGVQVATNAVAGTASNAFNRIAVAVQANNGGGSLTVGQSVAHAAIWLSQLDPGSILDLANGTNPLDIANETLLFYAPLMYDYSNLAPGTGRQWLALTGTPANLPFSDNPPVNSPRRRNVLKRVSARPYRKPVRTFLRM